MIAFVEGLVVEKSPTRVVLDVRGVGYEVFIPLSSYDRLPKEQQSCRMLTYDYVRDDQHNLYGFVTEAERAVFVKLMGVSGIGPKLALCVLSGLSVRDLIAAVAAGDVKRLSAISGIGKKTAERMVVELRDKFQAGEVAEATAAADPWAGNRSLRDAVLALISLGYKQAEARNMVAAHAPPAGAECTVEELVRKALNG